MCQPVLCAFNVPLKIYHEMKISHNIRKSEKECPAIVLVWWCISMIIEQN